MQKRYLYSMAGLFAGAMILFISLFKATSSQAFADTNVAPSGRCFYFNREILPDHLLYPVVAAKEQIDLLFLPTAEVSEGKLKLSDKRFAAAEKLLQSKKYDFALVTFFKAEQYLFQTLAENTATSSAIPIFELQTSLKEHHHTLLQLKSQFPDNLQSKLQTLIEQQELLLEKIN